MNCVALVFQHIRVLIVNCPKMYIWINMYNEHPFKRKDTKERKKERKKAKKSVSVQ